MGVPACVMQVPASIAVPSPCLRTRLSSPKLRSKQRHLELHVLASPPNPSPPTSTYHQSRRIQNIRHHVRSIRHPGYVPVLLHHRAGASAAVRVLCRHGTPPAISTHRPQAAAANMREPRPASSPPWSLRVRTDRYSPASPDAASKPANTASSDGRRVRNHEVGCCHCGYRPV